MSKYVDRTLLSGDFNIPGICWKTNTIAGHQYAQKVNQLYLDLSHDLGVEQIVDFPTRQEHFLDLLFTSHPAFKLRCKQLPPLGDKSDHDIVLYDSTHEVSMKKPQRRKIHLWKKMDETALRSATTEFALQFRCSFESMNDIRINEIGIIKLLKGLNQYKASGPDQIPTRDCSNRLEREMDEQRMKEEKQRQIEEEKKKVFRIPKKSRPPEEITEQTNKSAKLSAQENLEKAKKLAASFGKAKTVVSSSKSDSNKSSSVSDKSSSKHKHDKPSYSEQRQTGNDKHSNDKDVPKQSDKKPSYKDKLEKMSDQEKLAIIKKISGSLGRVGDKISDTEKLDKIRKISETIEKGSSSNSDKNENPNGYPKYSPLSSKKRYALQEKAARIRAMMNKPEEPKPRERKKGKDRAFETEAKEKKSETSKNEDDEQRKYSDFKKYSSHSSDTKYNDKYSDDKSSDRSSRKEKSVKKKKPPPPTSMNFNQGNDLLKIAEQKAQEPAKIEVIKKLKKEEDRLLTKREMASQREFQEYLKNKKIRREAEIEERQTVDVKREKQISNSLKSKSTSNLVTKSASSSQNTVRKNPYSEKLVTKSSSPLPSSSKPSSSNKLGKSMSSSSIPSKPFTKQFKLHSATNSQHNSDSNPAKKIKREHIENERISQKDEHRKKSNGAKRSNYDDVRENVLVCEPPKNEKPIPSIYLIEYMEKLRKINQQSQVFKYKHHSKM
ncbi:unnamed protein product [Mytilus coruscus]|uniref:Endonuclease/exonuclease/phosphatase domain-containing protein n=1 Tax=Mytilus coruscus TaxID=42192 RepID=A0A6J8ALJ2_MYTCO|nr:unnamed protein product [Mytilus coruscus]